MVSDPTPNGVFDGSQSPVVQVCEWSGAACIDPPLVELTAGTGPGTIQVDLDDEAYGVPWHAGDFGLDPSKVYRIRVLVGAQELGHADVQVLSNGSGLKDVNTNDFIGLVENRTLMIRFRIEEGALGLTIDATALTVPQLFLRGDASINFDPRDVQVLELPPGSYWLAYQASPASFPRLDFTVESDGTVDHDASLDGFVEGRGSATLRSCA